MNTTWFLQVGMKDVGLVGGKNASLGEMITNLKQDGVPVPYGFAITTIAYDRFLEHNGLREKIFSLLSQLDVKDLNQLEKTSQKIIGLFKLADFPPDIKAEIKEKFEILQKDHGAKTVAVRSSASLEDLPDASFAGQQETFLHVESLEDVYKKSMEVFSSLFGARALSYRDFHGFNHFDVKMSVGIQKMCNSDDGVSGVMFTIDPESGFQDAIVINSAYGLGESIVQGIVNPDEYIVYKKFPAILHKKLGRKEQKIAYNNAIAIPKELQDKFSLTDSEVFLLANYGIKIEIHYQKPMDIEWAKDGDTGEIVIVQARPVTADGSKKAHDVDYEYFLPQKSSVLAVGRSVGKKIGQGRARVLKNLKEASSFNEGEVLITDMTDPNWEPVMQKAAAVVTDRGGRTCHAAIIARELGLPCLVGTERGTKLIADSSLVTISCAEGDTGYVYEGLLPIEKRSKKVDLRKDCDVDLMLIAADPEKAFGYQHLPHKGIGLLRLEFIIQNTMGIHPNALINYDNLSTDFKQKINDKIKGYNSPEEFYIKTLSQGLMRLAAAVYPHPAIVRLSDFKSNEYGELLGGELFESKENNPMLGFRGAFRYISQQFKEAFRLECAAIKEARNSGFNNIWVMVPFVRTIKEANLVKEALKENGLISGQDDLKIIMMCEIPSNVILAKEFLQIFDGFSIGSNDLTQLTLGLDRDSSILADSFDEMDEAMLKMFKEAIDRALEEGKYVGFCGQGPSDKPELAQWLKEAKIHSISVNPDTILKTFDNLSV